MNIEKTYSIEHVMLKRDSVLIRKFFGTVEMADIIEAWRDDIYNGVVTADLNAVITDFSKAENFATMSEMKDIAAFYLENKAVFSKVKMALVLDAPNISIGMLFEKKHPEFQHRIFSTLAAALYWVKQ